MAKSISKAQAEALADGFFDSIGTDEEFEPVETLSTLIQMAGELIGEAQENLNSAGLVDTGALSDSLKILNPEVVGNRIQVDIEALFYYAFRDQGVKGTRGGQGKYSFRNERVGGNMLKAIRKWVIREKLKMRTTRKNRPITKREVKRQTITETSNAVAYAIATAVKRKGLKRTLFFTKAIMKTQNNLKDLSIPFKVDIIKTLPKNINGNSNK